MKIPENLKFMDSGTVVFNGPDSMEAAVGQVLTVLGAYGRAEAVPPCDVALDCSGRLRDAFITAHIEKSGQGWAVMFQEADAVKKSVKMFCLLIFALAIVPLVCAVRSGFAAPAAVLYVVCAMVYLYLVFFPSGACIRRMQKIENNFLLL